MPGWPSARICAQLIEYEKLLMSVCRTSVVLRYPSTKVLKLLKLHIPVYRFGRGSSPNIWCTLIPVSAPVTDATSSGEGRRAGLVGSAFSWKPGDQGLMPTSCTIFACGFSLLRVQKMLTLLGLITILKASHWLSHWRSGAIHVKRGSSCLITSSRFILSQTVWSSSLGKEGGLSYLRPYRVAPWERG